MSVESLRKQLEQDLKIYGEMLRMPRPESEVNCIMDEIMRAKKILKELDSQDHMEQVEKIEAKEVCEIDEKGIKHYTEIQICQPGKIDCIHKYVEDPDCSVLACNPPIYCNYRICKNCGQLERVKRRVVDLRKKEFKELYDKYYKLK
jgi:hypothetical protein